jgi:hypothetical protein
MRNNLGASLAGHFGSLVVPSCAHIVPACSCLAEHVSMPYSPSMPTLSHVAAGGAGPATAVAPSDMIGRETAAAAAEVAESGAAAAATAAAGAEAGTNGAEVAAARAAALADSAAALTSANTEAAARIGTRTGVGTRTDYAAVLLVNVPPRLAQVGIWQLDLP